MKHIRCRKAAVLMMGIAGVGLAQAQEAPIGAPQDWSSRAVITAKPMTPDELDRAGRSADIPRLYRDPRYVASVLRRIENETPRVAALAKTTSPAQTGRTRDRTRPQPGGGQGGQPNGNSETVLRDWSNVLGGGADGQGGRAAPGIFPAKYNLDIFAPPSCSGDFVVYTTNAAGASQSGTAQEQWSGSFSNNPTNGQTVTIGLAGSRRVQLTASTSSNTGLNFQIGADATATATNLRNAITRWEGQTGFRAAGAGTTVTLISNTAGDINNSSIASTLSNITLTRTYSGTASAGQPTVLAFNQLYNTTCNAGRTNTNAPNVMWAYNTGTGYITETSPVLSYLDGGKQVAFVQRNGNTLQLVLLKPGSGSGTAANPASPTLVSNAAYRGCSDAGGCYTTISFSTAAGANNVTTTTVPTYSSPFVDYSGDILWVGDGNGILHKFTGVFQGSTPAEVTSGGFPKAVDLGLKLSSPVFDYNGSVYVGSESGNGNAATDPGGKLYRINASTGAIAATSAKLALANMTGVRESPILDLRSNSVYLFIFNDNTTSYTDTAHCQAFQNELDGCRAIFRFATNFASATSGARVWIGRGNSTTRTLYAGGFDDAFYNSANGTGSMYITGGRNSNTFYATLWKVPITAGVLGSPIAGPEFGVRDRYTDGDAGTGNNGSNDNLQILSPVTVIKNPHTGYEYLYASTASWGKNLAGCGNGTYAGGACLYMYRLNQQVTTGTNSNETWTLRITSSIPQTGGGSITVNGTTLNTGGPGANIDTSGNRSSDRTNLINAINGVAGYTAAAVAGSGCGGGGGNTCELTITRNAFGNVADSTVTNNLTNVTTQAHSDGSTTSTAIQDITWDTSVTPTAALAVTAGNGAAPATQVPGGTGGIVVDNVRPDTETGTSQVYFTQGGVTGNAIQASQSGLQ